MNRAIFQNLIDGYKQKKHPYSNQWLFFFYL